MDMGCGKISFNYTCGGQLNLNIYIGKATEQGIWNDLVYTRYAI